MLQRSRLPAIGTDSTSVREAETFMAATDRPPEVSPPPLLIMRRPSPSRSFVLASLRAFYGLGGHLDLSDAGPDGAVTVAESDRIRRSLRSGSASKSAPVLVAST